MAKNTSVSRQQVKFSYCETAKVGFTRMRVRRRDAVMTRIVAYDWAQKTGSAHGFQLALRFAI